MRPHPIVISRSPSPPLARTSVRSLRVASSPSSALATAKLRRTRLATTDSLRPTRRRSPLQSTRSNRTLRSSQLLTRSLMQLLSLCLPLPTASLWSASPPSARTSVRSLQVAPSPSSVLATARLRQTRPATTDTLRPTRRRSPLRSTRSTTLLRCMSTNSVS